jgi:hypothetical protein
MPSGDKNLKIGTRKRGEILHKKEDERKIKGKSKLKRK